MDDDILKDMLLDGGMAMAINKGYLTCDRTQKGDEVYTPYYAVEPLLEFIPKNKIIWCPFDEEWSAFYNTFKEMVTK